MNADYAPVVVGIDGSQGSRAALRWAIQEAIGRGAPLEVVHAWRTPLLQMPSLDFVDRGDEAAEEFIAGELATVGFPAALVHVQRKPHHGMAAKALIEASKTAAAVVVGSSRDHSPFGPLAARVVEHARCPVVVVPSGPARRRGGVIAVGVDGSASASHALQWAQAEADRTGSRVVAVYAETAFEHALGASRDGADYVEPHDALERFVAGALGPRTAHVGLRVAADGAVPALVSASRTADLVVVGARGLGLVRSRLIGSVSERLIELAEGPVAIIGHAAGSTPDRESRAPLATSAG